MKASRRSNPVRGSTLAAANIDSRSASVSSMLMTTALLLVFLCSDHDPLALAVEVVSAFTTTGVSMGVTDRPMTDTAAHVI